LRLRVSASTLFIMLARPLSLRSTLWALAALVLVAAPHAERLPLWLSSLTAAICVWRVYLARTRLDLPSRWLLILIVCAAAAGIYLQYRTLFGREAGVALLVLMVSLKLLETRTQRDGIVLVFMSYFLVITNFLYSQSIPTALYLLACVWLITAAMIGLQYVREHAGYRHQLRAAGIMLMQSVPLMLVLFLLFPRVQGPLWGLPSDAASSVTGLSETMSPGTINKLALSDDVAFRATFEGAAPRQNQLYWRGPVMWDFDGRTWRIARYIRASLRYDAVDTPVRYAVTLEPHNQRWLFALDLPGKLPPRTSATSDFQLLSAVPINNRLRYEMESYLKYEFGRDDDAWQREQALHLPAGFNPRTIAYARTLRARFASNQELVQEVLTAFRREKFVYTLEPPLLGTHTTDEFLFDTRAGFCEHYASAFVILMRAAGIPARVVTGYLGGEMNPLGNYMIVRQSDAHAWAEIWQSGKGWIRIDPTQTAAPARAESGLAAAVPSKGTSAFFARGDNPILHRLRLTLDSAANAWNQWVLGYNIDRQREFLSRAGFDDATWRSLAIAIVVATTLITLLLALSTLALRRRQARDPVTRAYEAFCASLARAGHARRSAEGPVDFASRLTAARPDISDTVSAITRLYVNLRYGATPRNEELAELEQRVDRFLRLRVES
jgi:transglutaminase-like putative cysteine protease